ncbi:MAG TPA: hypothetical protein VGC45_09520 [Gryllotalpicola sp.]
MTALSTASAASAPRRLTEGDRIWRVVRLQYVNWRSALMLPWAILIGILLVNMTIWYLISSTAGPDTTTNTQYTGSIFYLLIYQAILAMQLMNATFSFALGLSSTRRDYYLGTSVWFLLHSAQYTVGVVLLSYIEQWTNGWGVGGHMFQTVYFGTGPLGERLFTIFFALLGALFLGSIFGAVYVRWRANGLYVTGAVLVAAVLGVLTIATLTDSWGAIGRWFAGTGPFGLVAWSVPLTALCAVIGFVALRRALPRS